MGKICNQCNNALDQNANFCTFCGSNNIREENVIQNQNIQMQQSTQTSSVEQQVQPQVQMQNETQVIEPQEVNKLTQNNIALENNEVHQDFTTLEFPSSNDPVPTPQQQQQPATPQAPVVPSDFKLQSGNDINQMPDANNPFDESLNAQKISDAAKKANKKTMKTILITIAITIGILIVILAIFIIFVSVSVDFKQEGLICQDPAPLAPNQMRIGAEGYGFLTIPNTWQDITSQNGTTIQYANNTGWIVTIGATTPEQLTAESYANLVESNLQKETTEKVIKEQATLNNYSAYKISASVPNYQKYIVAWTFAAEDGNVHYLAIEGPTNSGQEFSLVQTFGVCR